MAEFEAKIVKLCSGWETQVPKEVEAFYLDGRKYDVKETGETLEVIAGYLKDVATTRTAYRRRSPFATGTWRSGTRWWPRWAPSSSSAWDTPRRRSVSSG